MNLFMVAAMTVGGFLFMVGPEWWSGDGWSQGTEKLAGILFFIWAHLWTLEIRLGKGR